MLKLEDSVEIIPPYIYERLANKITEFLPPQEEALKKGLFSGENMLISAPTASGKTLIAEMAILNAVSQHKKAIYVAPMRALISEKFKDFHESYPDIRCALSMGDYNESDSKLTSYDVIFVSTEKLDSLLRNSRNYIGNIGCIVYDEIHLLTDIKRGPTLEFLIALNKKIFPSAQIICLSATIDNGTEIARWIGCKLVHSEFRPVKLVKKIYFDGELLNGKTEQINNVDDHLLNIVLELLKNKKQALIFAQTKKVAVSNTKLISTVMDSKLSKEEKESLYTLSNSILKVLDRPTSQCEELSEAVKHGVAFHHAGLINKQRELIENAFRQGQLKLIVATPTLAMGVNLPANTVVISSVYRYGDYGSEPMPALEVEQMLGRAGRPKYDKEGTAIIISRNERDLDLIKRKYFEGNIEPIISKFNSEIAVRKYVLSLIDMALYDSESAVKDFFEGLFISYQGIDIFDKIEDAIEFLLEHGFIVSKNGKLSTTRLGKLINSLYLDPYTGVVFIRFIEKSKGLGKLDTFSALHVLFCTEEFKFIRISQSEFQKYEEESYTLNLVADQNLIEYDRFISAIKMAHIIWDWLEEKGEPEIEEMYKVLPGEFYVTLESLRWLMYGLKELSRALGGSINEIARLNIRIKYGIKEELLPLVSIPDVGRIRARKLYSNGFKTVESLKDANMTRLSHILGAKIANKIYSYLHKQESQRKLI